ILLFLVEEHVVDPLLEIIKTAGRFGEPSTGIAFVLPVDQVVGLESQIEKFKEQVRNQYF
ncbi:P-II family nitrogen regulator, partial [Arthrospira platensis SPKY1]|nr:P-II family nitrogen regulator [Arthrospira platensis SPKY1]